MIIDFSSFSMFWYFFFIIIVFVLYSFFLKDYYYRQWKELIEEQNKKKKKLQETKERLANVEKRLLVDKENLCSLEENIKKNLTFVQSENERLEIIAKQLMTREEILTKQMSSLTSKEEKIENEKQRVAKAKKEVMHQLGKDIFVDDEAKTKEIIFGLFEEEIKSELDSFKEETIKKAEKEARQEATKIICLAMEKCTSDLIVSKATSSLIVDNSLIVSKIIGKEGRNINAFRRITGTDIIIDKEVENSINIQISSFNSLRREIALQTLDSLIKSEKISPLQIEKTYEETKEKINQVIAKKGQDILDELEISGVHQDLVEYLGRLNYRTSYGQNVLDHSLEVARIMGIIASELNLDVILARRVGLFHDIGKAIDDENNHVISGINLAKKYKEPEVVVNAIASHHRDFRADNIYSIILLSADKISAGRPGARGYQLEAYVERMNNLEKIANSFSGIKKSYAFQAGREVWVIVDPDKLNDYQSFELSKKIRDKIRKEIIIPGEVVINVIREKVFLQKLNDKKNLKRNLSKNKT